MPRIVKPDEYAAKRAQIVDAAQRLVFTKGFQQMSIGDILAELKISSGAFHHYFSSREALLEALIERIGSAVEAQMLPLIHDPQLSAIEKLQGFFDTLDRLRTAQRATIIALGRVWYTDGNAVVRLRVDEAVFAQRAPLLAEIVRQGVREGVFNTSDPEQAGEVVLSLLQGMGNKHAHLFLALAQGGDEARGIAEVVATFAAYVEAIERVLGAPPNALRRIDAQAVAVWAAALRNNEKIEEKEGQST